jgi:hypothetical protein
MEDDVNPDKAIERGKHWETILQQKLLVPFHEAILQAAALASVSRSQAAIHEEFAGFQRGLCGTLANMIGGLAMTVTDAKPEGTKLVVSATLAMIAGMTDELQRQFASGVDDGFDIHLLRNDKEVAYDFREHIAPATPDSGRASEIGGAA